MSIVTVVIDYDDTEENDISYGYGMTTSDLPKGIIIAVQFGDALTETEDDT